MPSPGQFLNKIADNIEKAIIGKRKMIDLILISLISKGHILIEDVPGVGKTSLISAIAKSVDCSFNRIQFTPDVTPSDVIGFSMYNRKTNEFEYKHGAVFCQFLLADEINRTSSKTQSSLLEVMEERQVTVDSVTYKLPTPFIVFATQNPIEYIGTYPLPEAQLDRFFMKISLGYPNHKEEMDIIELHKKDDPVSKLTPVASPQQIIQLQEMVDMVHMNNDISHYIVSLVEKTRNHPQLALGASPRVSISLAKAARAYALSQDRKYVTPDDVQKMAIPVMAHRLQLTQEAKFQNITQESIVNEIVKGTAVAMS